MKTSTTKRKAIADAVELLKEESPNAPGNIAGVQPIPIEKVRAFKNHPFRLYEALRESIYCEMQRDEDHEFRDDCRKIAFKGLRNQPFSLARKYPGYFITVKEVETGGWTDPGDKEHLYHGGKCDIHIPDKCLERGEKYSHC